MDKLTAKKCREMFLNLFEDKRQDGITLKEDLYMQALQIALPILEQQERGEWIEWKGGECPVADFTIIDLKYRDGRVFKGELAGNYLWANGYYHYLPETDSDIIAYRIAPGQSTDQNGEW